MRSASNLWEWLAANFSKQYHCWMKHKRHENQRNDHKLVKLVILNKFSLLIPQVMFKERYGEYRFWCWSLMLYFINWLSGLLWFRSGLEPGSSDSKPIALTTGLPNKAVASMCPRYSWARVLKVAACTVVRSYIQIFSAWWVTTILYNYGLRSASAAINTISTR